MKKPGYAKTATQVVRVVPKSDKIFVTNLRYEYFNKYTSYLHLFQSLLRLMVFLKTSMLLYLRRYYGFLPVRQFWFSFCHWNSFKTAELHVSMLLKCVHVHIHRELWFDFLIFQRERERERERERQNIEIWPKCSILCNLC